MAAIFTITITYTRTIPTVKFGKEEVTYAATIEIDPDDDLATELAAFRALLKADADAAEAEIFATSTRPIDMPPQFAHNPAVQP